VPVVWVQHADDELVRGTPDWALVPGLGPAEGEVLIHKGFNSAFEKTALQEELTRLGVRRIVLAGAASNWCIRATAYRALERGYDLLLVEDGHTTSSIEFADGRNIEAESIVRELNVAMKWLSYPDRVNGIVAAGAIEFGSGAA
jgi:nicotinamidase-related amidase